MGVAPPPADSAPQPEACAGPATARTLRRLLHGFTRPRVCSARCGALPLWALALRAWQRGARLLRTLRGPLQCPAAKVPGPPAPVMTDCQSKTAHRQISCTNTSVSAALRWMSRTRPNSSPTCPVATPRSCLLRAWLPDCCRTALKISLSTDLICAGCMGFGGEDGSGWRRAEVWRSIATAREHAFAQPHLLAQHVDKLVQVAEGGLCVWGAEGRAWSPAPRAGAQARRSSGSSSSASGRVWRCGADRRTRTIWVDLVDELGWLKVLCIKHVLLFLKGRLYHDVLGLVGARRRPAGPRFVRHGVYMPQKTPISAPITACGTQGARSIQGSPHAAGMHRKTC